jgi:hypothetical protein
MADTTLLELPLIAASQAQKHVTHNEALLRLDALVALSVIDRDLAAPPVSPADGERYLVAAGASGDWVDQDDRIAVFQAGAWIFLVPREGWTAWIEDEGRHIAYHAGAWMAGIAASQSGATIALEILEEEVTTSASASLDTTIEIPDRAIVFAVSTRTTEAVSGAVSYDCGIAGEPGKFGATLGVAAGSANSGVIGPAPFYAAAPVRLTANGGDFSGGKIRVAIQFMRCAAPAV